MQVKPWKIPYPFKKLKKPLIDKLVKAIGNGIPHKIACLARGITPRIFDMWCAQGACDLECEKADSLCAYLVLSLNEIKENKVELGLKAITARPQGHAGYQWYLEHALWKHFGTKAENIELAEEMDRLREQINDDKSSEVRKVKAKNKERVRGD